jgi:hypothetical protein
MFLQENYCFLLHLKKDNKISLSHKKYLLGSITTVSQKFCYMDQLQPQFKDLVELTTTAIKKRVDVAQSKKRIIPHAFQQIIREVGDRISAKQRVCHYMATTFSIQCTTYLENSTEKSRSKFNSKIKLAST